MNQSYFRVDKIIWDEKSSLNEQLVFQLNVKQERDSNNLN